RRTATAVAFLALLSAGCQASSHSPVRAHAAAPVPTAAAPSPTASAAPKVDPRSVHADELGVVPVLMYHQLLAHPKGDYDQTPAQFRAELTALYRSGYRTVTAADLVAGRVDVPAGRSPMVLTFDDSTISQYAERPDGSVDPGTAVGILEDVAHRFGEQHPVATFYVNAAPFRGHDSYLAHLAALGMEIGDHTATHANLRQLDATGVQRELVQGLAVITGAVPGVRVTTMALPFGAHPRDRQLSARGSWQGRSYAFSGVLLVGSNPSRSPYSKDFTPQALPRIRSGLRTGDQAFTSTYWLPRLLKTRFVSDGDPATISFPRSEVGRLAPRFARQARPY
ncbi:MAG: polysaccharide deacetylase family protein, partial [Mycobacteriales bacterium]